MSSQSITLPSTPTAGAVASFGTTISPRAASIEARLELSLDELIKERKKEFKEKKHESVKKETTMQRTEQAQGAKVTKKATAAKVAQSEKRSALVNMNRGLPALATISSKNTGGTGGKSAKKKKKYQKTKPTPTPVTVVGKKATKQKQTAATAAAPVKAQVPQKKTKGASATPAAKQQPPAPPKKQNKQQQVVRIIRHQPPAKAKSNGSASASAAAAKPRRVVRSSDTRSKIRITIQQRQPSASAANHRKPNRAGAPQKTAIMNVVLPAKVARNFSSRAAARAEKVVRRVQSRKQATSKNGAFVVRKPFTVRKL
ncbi:hypothetical protein PybrP1_007644 [[Pythium] brassicae (nom. inval.)]|nr:hypothetical protein PybrP1_007644 [[Pythium] brassicae (nom. inval.)]